MDNRKLKLFFITHTHSAGGGAEKVLTTLVNNLNPQKYEITIQEIYGYKIKKEPVNSNIKLLSPIIDDIKEFEFNKQFKRYCIEKYPLLIRDVKNWNDSDIVISWNYQAPSFLLPAFIEKKTIAWFHGAINDLQNSDNLKSVQYNLELQKSAWSIADKIITISKNSLKSLSNVLPEYIHKAAIIYNPFDIAQTQKQAEEKIKLNINNLPSLICIGRLDSNKNFSLVIKSAAKLKKNNIHFNLIIIGEGIEKKALTDLVKKLHLEDRVFILGYKKNVIPYIKISKILCVSSLAEGFPTVVCEAMALGKPFVTTPVAGSSEELSDQNRCGLIADWNEDDYSEKIKQLLTNEILYDKMSENCLKKINEFSAEKAIENFESIIANIFEKPYSVNTTHSKSDAIKKIKKLYIWCPDFALQRLKFAINRFYIKRNKKDLFIILYHIMKFIFYIILLPVRIIAYPKIKLFN